VDYEGTRRLAKAALERGGNDRVSTGQLYLLWAMAAAALDLTDEARKCFAFAVAINPELKLDRSVSPKIRGPYLEARGSLSNAEGQPPLEVKLKPRRQSLELELRDTLSLVGQIELSLRVPGQPYIKQKLAPAPIRRVDVPSATHLQAFALVLDGYGNVVAQLGSADEAERLLFVASDRPQSASTRPRADVNRTPYYVGAGALAALGLGAGGVATAMYFKREAAAEEWNGSSCELPGRTRLEQCGAVDDRRQRAENMAIGFSAAGGALLLGSALSFWLAPSSSQPPSVALDAGAGNVMLHLRGRL
jgi:hypothetical protein